MFNYVVNDVSYAGSLMRGEILGLERRRFWRDEDKLVLWIWQASEVLEATARHAIYGVQWRWLDRHRLGREGPF